MIDKNQTPKETTFCRDFFETTGTYIHPSSIIGKDVLLGQNVKIGPFCTIIGNTKIESNTRVHGYVSIGSPAQDTKTFSSLGSIEIGKNCEIREFVTIGAPKKEDGITSIGNQCYIMNFSHVAHDVIIEDNVTLINNVNLAGHVHVEKNVMLMANTAVHQFCKIGSYSALAPFSGIRQDLPPFCLFNGRPGRYAGLNLVALKRANFSNEQIASIKMITRKFFQEKLPLNTIAEDCKDNNCSYVQQFIHFAKNSSRGITRKTIND